MDRGRELSSWGSAHPGISNGLNIVRIFALATGARDILPRHSGCRWLLRYAPAHCAMVGQHHRCHDEFEGGSVQRFGSTQWILLRHQNDKCHTEWHVSLVRVDGAGWTHRHI